MDKLKCKVCGYGWMPRVLVPKECPRCKNREWKVRDYKRIMKDIEDDSIKEEC